MPRAVRGAEDPVAQPRGARAHRPRPRHQHARHHHLAELLIHSGAAAAGRQGHRRRVMPTDLRDGKNIFDTVTRRYFNIFSKKHLIF